MRRAVCCALALVLTGCIAARPGYRMGPVDEMIPPQPDRCGLAALPAMQGLPMARLAGLPLTGPLRVLWPGQEVTDDIRPERLNAEVDLSGNIRRLFCG